MKILVVKNEDNIIISKDGKRLIIDKNNELFNTLNPLSKRRILLNFMRGGELNEFVKRDEKRG